eukprot:CAMPEP_0194208926 /NCGR_PEP_ID=MMETSP0156-20130528/7229_1 /TAXON_ID=33649 /ORGANISM="Thalassionema nitzschioides, Strain L26-B" /LENGTH=72 /DNA_ID=CAMNT_0038935993 /DNA_START=205 /DNA_END=423 /DNA_ORIENTATION=-
MNRGQAAKVRGPWGPAIALAVTSSAAIGAIFYTHYSQVRDRRIMREGVERDKERLKIRRYMNQKEDGIQQNA